MFRIRYVARQNKTMLKKTGSYYMIHTCVAAMVAYAVIGNFWASLTLSLLEPTVQAVAFFFHEKAWGRAAKRRAEGHNPSAPASQAEPLCASSRASTLALTGALASQ